MDVLEAGGHAVCVVGADRAIEATDAKGEDSLGHDLDEVTGVHQGGCGNLPVIGVVDGLRKAVLQFPECPRCLGHAGPGLVDHDPVPLLPVVERGC